MSDKAEYLSGLPTTIYCTTLATGCSSPGRARHTAAGDRCHAVILRETQARKPQESAGRLHRTAWPLTPGEPRSLIICSNGSPEPPPSSPWPSGGLSWHPSFWHYLAEPVRQQSLWPDCVTAAHLQWALPHGSRACALCLWAPSTPGRLGHGGRFRAGGLLQAGILRAWASVGFPSWGHELLGGSEIHQGRARGEGRLWPQDLSIFVQVYSQRHQGSPPKTAGQRSRFWA